MSRRLYIRISLLAGALLPALLLGGCLAGGTVPSGPVGEAETAVNDLPGGACSDVGMAGEAASDLDLPVPQAAAFFPDDAPVNVPLDAETAEDNRLLTGEDQAPPADEGPSVAAPVAYDVPVVENAKVRYYLDYYSGPGRKTFARWLERSERYLPMMREIFAEEGLPQDLVYLALVESGFNPKAYSWAHAVGPWQFIESTGRMMGLESNWWLDERRDFEKSTRAAARFLRDLHRRFDGDWYLAIAAYNAGPGKVSRAIRRYDTRDFWELTRGSYLQTETKNYVPKFLAALLIAKNPEAYGFSDLDYQAPIAYATVRIPSTTDLEVVAELCAVEYESIEELNPELKRWCTPPDTREYTLRIPAESRERFEKGYAGLPEAQRANYLRHRVAKGDTLLALAKRYGIRVQDIVDLNRIRNPRALQIGQDLILPLRQGTSPRVMAELADDYDRTRLRTYTVRKGDSLWEIARRFGVSERQLRVWNRLGWSNVIRPGQKLQVSASASQPTRTTEGRKVVYEVRSGDTLWAIGRRFNVATRKIMDWNNLNQDHVLRPGDKLTLIVGS